MITTDYVFTVLKDWIKAVLEVNENQIAKTIPPQNAPGSDGLRFAVNFLTVRRVGAQDFVGRTNEDTVMLEAQRRANVSIHAVGPGAYQALVNIDLLRNMPSVKQIFTDAKVGIYRTGEVRNLSELDGARFKERAQMDVSLYAASTFTESVDLAQSADLDIEIDGQTEIEKEIVF